MLMAASEVCRNDLFAGFLTLLLGAVMIIWPKRIQQVQIRWQDRHPKLSALNPFSEWNRSAAAALLIRFTGFIPVCFGLLAFVFAYKNCLK